MSMKRMVGAGLALSLLAGCTSLPNAGPTRSEIQDQAHSKNPAASFEIVPVNSHTVDILKDHPNASLARSFGDRRPSPDLRLGVGDAVVVSIWDAQSLAVPSGTTVVVSGNRMAPSVIPRQYVSRTGTITVPFAGAVRVRGLTLQGAQAVIEKKLGQTLQDPQVQLTLAKSAANSVTVVSDAGGSGRVPLTLGGDRLLDVLASANSLRLPLFQTAVQLTRHGRTVDVSALRIVRDPKENVYMRPGDVVSVLKRVPKFIALGATGMNRDVPFDDETITLTEALGKVGGLADWRADPEGVFVFRFEPYAVAKRLEPKSPLVAIDHKRAPVPVVYQINMRKAGSFFLARNFPIYNQDILYVSDAPLTELQKFLNLIQGLTQPVLTGVTLRNSFH